MDWEGTSESLWSARIGLYLDPGDGSICTAMYKFIMPSNYDLCILLNINYTQFLKKIHNRIMYKEEHVEDSSQSPFC